MKEEPPERNDYADGTLPADDTRQYFVYSSERTKSKTKNQLLKKMCPSAIIKSLWDVLERLRRHNKNLFTCMKPFSKNRRCSLMPLVVQMIKYVLQSNVGPGFNLYHRKTSIGHRKHIDRIAKQCPIVQNLWTDRFKGLWKCRRFQRPILSVWSLAEFVHSLYVYITQ